MKRLFILAGLMIPVVAATAPQKDQYLEKAKGVFQTAADKAWGIEVGSRSIVVAAIDTGIDVSHPDLKDNIWTNPGESGIDHFGHSKANNGVDDDKNGFIDDVHGWNFVNNNNDLTDNHGHGTHVAGIIGAVGKNGIGISGVSQRVSLMALKYFDSNATESNNLVNTIRAIRYANQMRVHIINYSGGGFNRFREEERAIRESSQLGILFVAAAGNESSNLNRSKFYPANYEFENIVAVTGLDQKDNFLKSSNFGSETVHIAAPGEKIYSTLPNRKYGTMTGTSQATAFVSGAAALLLARSKEQIKPEKVIRTLLLSGEYDMGLNGKTIFKSRLNAHRALTMKDEMTLVNGFNVSTLSSRVLVSAHSPIPNEPVKSVARGPAHQATSFKISEVGDR